MKHTIVTRAPPRSFQSGSGGGGWAGAREVEERPAERERQRFSERRRELSQTLGENFFERALGPGFWGRGCLWREGVEPPPRAVFGFTLSVSCWVKTTGIK